MVYFSPMILVTGGTGFLGAHLLVRLTSEGARVKALKRPASSTRLTEKIFSYYAKDPSEQLQRVEWIDGDLTDICSLLEAFEGVEQLYHAAAMVSLNSGDHRQMEDANVAGTANVVNAALEKKVEKLCYVSSIGALGYEADNKIITEETPWDPSKNKSLYSKSKYNAEMEVWRGIAEGLNAVIVNPGVILGPGDWQQGSPRLFSTVYKGLKFYPPGTNGFVDVNDVVTAMIRLTERDVKEERFIVVSENLSYQQLFNQIADALGVVAPKYKAGKLLGEAGWRGAKAISLLTGKQPVITRDAIRSSGRSYVYSSDKLLNTIDLKMMPVKESVARTAKLFLQDKGK